MKPGAGVSGGITGTIKLDGVVTYGVSMAVAGGSSGSPVSLLNYKSYVGLFPADNINNNYQLPSPVTYPGRMYIIRNNSSSFNALITTAGGLIFPGYSSLGLVTFTLNTTSSPKTIMVISDGANWIAMKQD